MHLSWSVCASRTWIFGGIGVFNKEDSTDHRRHAREGHGTLRAGLNVKRKTRFSTSRQSGPSTHSTQESTEYWEHFTTSKANHFKGSTKLHPGYVAISARFCTHTHVATTKTVQHGKTAHKARFGILPSGGTLRNEAAFSNGVAQSVIALGAKTEVGYHTHVGSRPPSKIS